MGGIKRDMLEMRGIELVEGNSRPFHAPRLFMQKIPQTNLQIPCLSLKYHCAAFELELSVSKHLVISLLQPAPLD